MFKRRLVASSFFWFTNFNNLLTQLEVNFVSFDPDHKVLSFCCEVDYNANLPEVLWMDYGRTKVSMVVK